MPQDTVAIMTVVALFALALLLLNPVVFCVCDAAAPCIAWAFCFLPEHAACADARE
jgi:hypothetical protein